MSASPHPLKRYTPHLFLTLAAFASMSALWGVGMGFSALRASALEDAASAARAKQLAVVLGKHEDLLSRKVKVHVFRPGGMNGRVQKYTGSEEVLELSLRDHPSWVRVDKNASGALISRMDPVKIAASLTGAIALGDPKKASCAVLSSWVDDKGVMRAQTDCIGAVTYAMDVPRAADTLARAFAQGIPQAEVRLSALEPVLRRDSEHKEALTLLAMGESNFKGSGAGRKANVRKGLSEHVNNAVIPAGATFSFNDTLGGPVTQKNGWQMALTIVDGGTLVPAPGGGICQVSTTAFRAALRAGLPIEDVKSHSLFVAYYEKYGVGLDSTIFPGHQDFKFRNDTGDDIILQAWYDGDEARVALYGSDDHRSVVLTGPYFSQTPGSKKLHKLVRSGDIAWQRTVTLASGEQTEETFRSHYKAVPQTLLRKWPLSSAQTRGTTFLASAEF